MPGKHIVLKFFFLFLIGLISFFSTSIGLKGIKFYLPLFILFSLYIIFTFLEVKSKLSGLKNAIKSFKYFKYLPFSIIITRIILLVIILLTILIFLAPETRNFKILPILISFFLGELFFYVFEYFLNYQGIYFADDYFIFVQKSEKKIFSDEIELARIKYGVLYLILKSGRSLRVNPDFCNRNNRDEILPFFISWIDSNKIKLVKE